MKSKIGFMLCILLVVCSLPATGFAASYTNINEWTDISGSWEETEEGLTGTTGGNGFISSDVFVTGKKDFTYELDASGENAFGFGIAIFADDYAPESNWYCFQADTKSNNFTFFHIEDGTMKWQGGRDFSDTEKKAASYHLKVVYVASEKKITGYYNNEVIYENAGQEVSGYLALKIYECTATFNNITYTGSEAATPKPTQTATPTPAAGENTASPTGSAKATDAVQTSPTATNTQKASGGDKEEDNNTNPWIWIGGAAAIVVAAVVVTIIVVKKKKVS